MFGEYLGYLPPLLLERVIEAAQVSATGPIRYGWDADGDGEVTDLVSPPESPVVYTNYGTNTIILGVPGDDADLDTIVTAIPQFYDLVFNTVFTCEDTDGDGEPDTQVPEYGWKAGTSMAAPTAAEAAALVKSTNLNYNANQVESTLKSTADVPERYDKAYYGSGYLNIVDAL